MPTDPTPARRLYQLVEPLAAAVYFAPEANTRYAELGLEGGSGYFCSRAACMGRVTGPVVAMAFGVFEPRMVTAAVDAGWAKATPEALLDAREQGAVEQLERLIGDQADGAPRATELLRRAADAAPLPGHGLFAGLSSLGWPGSPLGDLWRAADLVREHRGDSHVIAWAHAGWSALDVMIVTELWWGLPHNSYLRTRAWPAEAAAASIAGLQARGYVEVSDGTPVLTAAGNEARWAIEDATDAMEQPLIDALGGDVDELFGLLEPWAEAIAAGGGYPGLPSDLQQRR